METIFTLPLAIAALVQALLALLLLCPDVISLPIAQVVSKSRKGTAVKSVLSTLQVLLLGLFVSSLMELVKGADKMQRGDMRVDLMASVDYLRSQVSCSLCILNLVLLLLSPALADSKRQLDFQVKNLDAMRRQVKGLQAEYERVTAKPAPGASSDLGDKTLPGGKSEVDSLKLQVDKLIREKNGQQDTVDNAQRLKAGAEAKLDAMVSQMKGFDKEYDRVLEENKLLQRRLAQVDQAGMGSGFKEVNKKDD